MQALKLYKLDNLRYPSSEQGFRRWSRPTVGVFRQLAALSRQAAERPWGHPYQFANPGLKGEIDVYSFGADGVVGGEKNNADIGSWQYPGAAPRCRCARSAASR